MPIPIKFGTKEENDPSHEPKTTTDKDGKETTEPQRKITVDNIINNPTPAWTKQPSELEDPTIKAFTVSCIQCSLKSLYSTFI